MLAHFWVAFVAFLVAIVLGEWQMYVRSPLHAWVNNPEHYYRSVTAHGTVMAYVLPTLVAMGFGYSICELALKRPLMDCALLDRVGCVAGTPWRAYRGQRQGFVLYTWYRRDRQPSFTSGFVRRRRIVGVGRVSRSTCANEENPGATCRGVRNVPAPLVGWTSVGAAIGAVLILPVSLGSENTIAPGFRGCVVVTLHA